MPAPAKGMKRFVRVRSGSDGFRRAGIKHTKVPVDHPAENLTDEQYAQLVAEPMLLVEVVDLPDETAVDEASKK